MFLPVFSDGYVWFGSNRPANIPYGSIRYLPPPLFFSLSHALCLSVAISPPPCLSHTHIIPLFLFFALSASPCISFSLSPSSSLSLSRPPLSYALHLYPSLPLSERLCFSHSLILLPALFQVMPDNFAITAPPQGHLDARGEVRLFIARARRPTH